MFIQGVLIGISVTLSLLQLGMCHIICDTSTVCLVKNDTDFTDSTLTIVQYSPPLGAINTAAVTINQMTYDFPIEITSMKLDNMFWNFEIYFEDPAVALTCTTAGIWMHGMDYSGKTGFPMVKRLRAVTNEPYCTFDLSHKFKNPELESYSPMYLLLNAMGTALGSTLHIHHYLPDEGELDSGVDPRDSILYVHPLPPDAFFHYMANWTFITMYNDYIGIEVLVSDIDNSGEPTFNSSPCGTLTRDHVMGSDVANKGWSGLSVGTCKMTYISGPILIGEGVLYEYRLYGTEYENCATTIEEYSTESINYTIYTYDIHLSDKVPNAECYNFYPRNGANRLSVNSSTTYIDGDADGIHMITDSIVLNEYGLERCVPLINYPFPHAKAVFYFDIVITGDNITIGSKTPFLTTSIDDSITINQLVLTDTVCDYTSSPTTCRMTLTSLLCRPIYSYNNTMETCFFGPGDDMVIKDLYFHELFPFSGVKIHSFPIWNTLMERQTFSNEVCHVIEDEEPIQFTDVSDHYTITSKIRNLNSSVPTPVSGTNPNWNMVSPVFFNKEVILQIDVSGRGIFENSDVQIQEVNVRIINPSNNQEIDNYLFTREDKKTLMEMSWLDYYDDVHFCRYTSIVTAGVNTGDSVCEQFHLNAAGAPPSRDRHTLISTSILRDKVPHYCQIASTVHSTPFNQGLIDDKGSDYFTFFPPNWFSAIELPEIIVKMDIVSVIQSCDSISDTKDYRRRMSENNDNESDIKVVYHSESFNVQMDESPQWIGRNNSNNLEITDSTDGIMVIIGITMIVLVVLVILVICCIIFRIWWYRSRVSVRVVGC